MNFDDSFAVLPDCYSPCFQPRVPGLCYGRFMRENHTLSSHATWGWHWLCSLETTQRSQTQQWISLISVIFWFDLLCFNYLSFQDFGDKLHFSCFCFCSWLWTGYTVGGQKCNCPHVLYGCIHSSWILGCKICPWNRIHSVQVCFVLLSVAKVKTFRPPRWFCQLGYPWFLDFRDLSWWSEAELGIYNDVHESYEYIETSSFIIRHF